MLRAFKRSRVAARVKALLAAESDLNAEIADALDSFKAGSSVVGYAKAVNGAERALRALEADAATRRMRAAQADAMTAQLAFLSTLQAGSAQGADAAVAKAARASVEAALESDARAQQATVEAAIKALAAGATAVADDTVAPLYAKALDAARKAVAAQPAAKPFASAAIQEIFRKRFGLVDDAVTPAALAAASKDPVAAALLAGKCGGVAPAVGVKFVVKPAIMYGK
jgi:hypothetical protein